ncbi:MAG TPA: SMI1/KNR4 family protein [Planctomycetia bacterium]|nr:SMI1/KNR4 family protein [Planctomycetia bacterium]
MSSYHDATFKLLGRLPQTATAALDALNHAERRLGVRLPSSVREWYSCADAVPILAEHSNSDPPIAVEDFTLQESPVGRLLPIRWENQGVCCWAVLLDGSDDPPVFVDVDTGGASWHLLARSFSAYVYACVWDYHVVLGRPALVQAQNGPISAHALDTLAASHDEQPRTTGWPGSVQYRFAGDGHGVLLWSSEGQPTDWFVGASDAASLESALRKLWPLDGVGESFHDCSPIAKDALARIRADA